jgi:hypothetical protein
MLLHWSFWIEWFDSNTKWLWKIGKEKEKDIFSPLSFWPSSAQALRLGPSRSQPSRSSVPLAPFISRGPLLSPSLRAVGRAQLAAGPASCARPRPLSLPLTSRPPPVSDYPPPFLLPPRWPSKDGSRHFPLLSEQDWAWILLNPLLPSRAWPQGYKSRRSTSSPCLRSRQIKLLTTRTLERRHRVWSDDSIAVLPL